MDYHDETAQKPLNPNIPSKNHKKIGMPSEGSLVLLEKQSSLRINDPNKKTMVRHPSKGLAAKTLETSPNPRRRQISPTEDKENTIAAKNRKTLGAKNFNSPKHRKPLSEISNQRKSVKIGTIVKNNMQNLVCENPEEIENKDWKTPQTKLQSINENSQMSVIKSDQTQKNASLRD